MNYANTILKFSLLLVISFNTSQIKAQFDVQCNGRDMHSLFFSCNYYGRIDNIDTNPSVVILSTSTHSLGGISINNILSIPGSSEVLYACNGFQWYFYWNGSSWVNTGHLSNAMSPGGTSQYIFNLDASAGIVYRYDGTPNSVPILTNLPTGLYDINDIVTDSAGNFYIIYTNFSNPRIVVYDPNGMTIDTIPITGLLSVSGDGAALVGGQLYVESSNLIYQGTMINDTCRFVNYPIVFPPNIGGIGNMASCPSAAYPLPIISKKLATSIFVYPNPAQNNVTVKAEKLLGKSCVFTITDVSGKKLKEEHNTFVTGTVTINVSKLKSGIYFLRMEDGRGSWVKRFVKE